MLLCIVWACCMCKWKTQQPHSLWEAMTQAAGKGQCAAALLLTAHCYIVTETIPTIVDGIFEPHSIIQSALQAANLARLYFMPATAACSRELQLV